MPARKRHKPGGVGDQPDLGTRSGRKVAQRSAAQIFAERREAEREEQRQAARVRREAQQREDRRRELNRAKDAAAARLKEVRRRDVPGAARAEAEAAYRAALDAVIRDEQGLPPLSEEEQAQAVAAPRELEAAEEAALGDEPAVDANDEAAGG
ncbi:hypothetical protein HC251_13440 [Iamia sp. SCSIO 61187]|uniref:hypothetical protein n=1 Tax=Iamia sp. SCSIO 61187 TaxID=2722752 RepID=UPI001C637516|nr:hypothetical protein [Iamia sp. SCSIO 61187]QYG93328.1 hypothetical protein HC251_13440 [Iamia sp. SCSIO 61187]